MVRKAEDRRYSFKQDASPPPPPTGGFTEDHIINPNIDIVTQIVRPKWPAKPGTPPRARNVFRILPPIDPDTGELLPCRYNEEPGNYASWLYGTYLADNIGVKNVCFLMGDNRFVDEQNLAESPLAVLNANLAKAFAVGEAPASWSATSASLIQIGRREFNSNSKSRPPLITRPKFVYLLQVAVVSHENKPADINWWGLNDNDPTIVLMISANAGMNLIAQLDSMPEIDPVDLNSGLFVDVHSIDDPPPGHTTIKTGGDFGYAVTLLSDFNGISPRLNHRVQDVLHRVRWWDDLVYIPSVEEQVQLICNSDLPASAIMYALGDDFGSYIPNTVKTAGRRAQSAPATIESMKPQIPTRETEALTQPVTTIPGKQTGESVAESLKRARAARTKQ